MRTHVSNERSMGLDIVLGPASGNANVPTVERIEVDRALKKSRVSKLHGLPKRTHHEDVLKLDRLRQFLRNRVLAEITRDEIAAISSRIEPSRVMRQPTVSGL